MHMVQTELDDAQLLTLTGRLDAEAAPALEERCRQLIESQTRTLIINLGTLDYLGSAGLRTLLGAGKSLQNQNGKLVLVATPGPIRQLIALAGFDKIFPLCATVDEAAKQAPRQFRISHTNDSGAEILSVSAMVKTIRSTIGGSSPR